MGGLTFSQNVSSLALTVWEQKGFEDLEEKDVSELINYKGVCRTAPATPGLLNVFTKDDSISQLMNQLITKLFVEQPRLHRDC